MIKVGGVEAEGKKGEEKSVTSSPGVGGANISSISSRSNETTATTTTVLTTAGRGKGVGRHNYKMAAMVTLEGSGENCSSKQVRKPKPSSQNLLT